MAFANKNTYSTIALIALMAIIIIGAISTADSIDYWTNVSGTHLTPSSSYTGVCIGSTCNTSVQLTIDGTTRTTSLYVNGQLSCLADGTNCPSIFGNNGTDGINGTNGINGSNGTGIRDIYLLTNGSLQINLTSNINITTANITGQKGNTGASGNNGNDGATGTNGTNGLNGTHGLNGTNGINGTNANIGLANTTFSTIINSTQDLSGNNSNVTVAGATYNATGENYNFDGTDDYMHIHNTTYLNYSTTNFSIRARTTQTTRSGGDRVIYSGLGATNSYTFAMTVDAGGDNMRCLSLNETNSVGQAIDSTTFNLNTWYDWTCTYDVTNRNMTLYRNGINVASLTWVGTLHANTLKISIGGEFGGDNNLEWNGAIDDVMFWNRLLTETEITTILNNGSVLNGLYGYYPFTNHTYIAQSAGNIAVYTDNTNTSASSMYTNGTALSINTKTITQTLSISGSINTSNKIYLPGLTGTGTLICYNATDSSIYRNTTPGCT